ncbi:MAG: hypothetical protein GX443_08190 [Deltaproteobacteria bacterium]|nr:hypothetical protein [Deltaproteobacteria bacterium]
MKSMVEPSQAQTLVDTLTDRPGLVALYLHGSMEPGNAHRDSDMDVVLLLPRHARPGGVCRLQPKQRASHRCALCERRRMTKDIPLNHDDRSPDRFTANSRAQVETP